MFRKTLTILSLVGLLLSTGLWGASYWNMLASSIRKTDAVQIVLSQGCLRFNYSAFVGAPRQPWNQLRVGGFAGFDTVWTLPYYSAGGSPRWPSLTAYVPVNLIALAFLILSGYLLSPSHRRRKRKKLGLCVKCGYDLRGSEERCPECNTPFENDD